MKKDVPAGIAICVVKGSSPATERSAEAQGRAGEPGNPPPQLLLGPSQGNLQPHGEDEYWKGSGAPPGCSGRTGSLWGAGQRGLGLRERDLGIFRGSTKGGEREGDKGISWPARGEQEGGGSAACPCASVRRVCAGGCGQPHARVHCMWVLACALVGNTGSAFFLAGPGGTQLWQPCLDRAAGFDNLCAPSTLRNHPALSVQRARFICSGTDRSASCTSVYWRCYIKS